MPVTSSAATSAVGLALQQSPIPALRKLKVTDTDREVIIVGSVSTYYLKQLAQETIMPLLEGRELLNQVMVVRSEPELSV